MKYRIVKNLLGKYRVQIRFILWFWRFLEYHDWTTLEEALRVMRDEILSDARNKEYEEKKKASEKIVSSISQSEAQFHDHK